MSKIESLDAAAPELLDQRFGGVVTQSGFADEFWCAAMRKVENGSDNGPGDPRPYSAAEPVCGKLRVMFEDVTSEPMPDCLTSLADRLDSALLRGDLYALKAKPCGR